MSDIFISYKREDQKTAKKLADALQNNGWSVWWDPKLRTGEHFDDAIEKALIDAKCVIVLWSKLSVKSRYVKDEATYALNRNKLVPIQVEETDLPFRFEGIQTGQLINWDGSDSFPAFEKVIADVKSTLGQSPVEMVKLKQKEAGQEAKKEHVLEQTEEIKRRKIEKEKPRQKQVETKLKAQKAKRDRVIMKLKKRGIKIEETDDESGYIIQFPERADDATVIVC